VVLLRKSIPQRATYKLPLNLALTKTMNIEFAKIDDSKQLSELVLSATEELRGVDLSEVGWDRFVSSNTPAEIAKKIMSAEFSFCCCVESNRILGFIALKDLEKIDRLFVIAEARNRGVASLLWKSAKKHAIENGASGKFWVRSSSVAVPVYKKFGFIPEGELQVIEGIRFQLMRL
jgi:GNAT superfamily N-acetyltransferase